MKSYLKYKATASYIFLILLSNLLFSIFPPIAIFGKQTLSPADSIVGVIYIARDFAQREIQSYVLLAMLCGGVLSYLFAAKAVAFASLSAFFIGELVEWVIFTWTKQPLSQRLLWSSACSCPIDTVIFLGLIHRLNWFESILMCSFKLLGVLFIWGYWRVRNGARHEILSLSREMNFLFALIQTRERVRVRVMRICFKKKAYCAGEGAIPCH